MTDQIDKIDRPLAVVILAAGKGSRMRSDLHKVLHPLCGKPMIFHLLDTVQKLDPERKIVVVGEGRQQVMDAVKNVDFAFQEKQLGTGHALQCCQENLKDFSGDILVLYGDVPLISEETIKEIQKAHYGSSGKRPMVTVLGFRPEDGKEYGRLVLNGQGQLDAIVEYKDASDDIRKLDFCNSGIMMLRSEALFSFVDMIEDNNANQEFYLTDLVAIARTHGHFCTTVEASPIEVTGVNSRSELKALEQEMIESGQYEI